MFNYGLLAALFALIFFSIGDTLSKSASEKLGHKLSAAVIVSAGIIPIGISLLFIHPNLVNLGVIFFGILAGAFTAIGFLFVFKSLETEQVTNTMSLVNIQYASVIIFGALALSETLSLFQLGGLLLIFAGGALVVFTKGFKINLKLVPAILGMLFWGLDIIVIVYALTLYPSAPSTISFFSRLLGGSFLFLFLLFTLKGKPIKLDSKPKENIAKRFAMALIAGTFDGLALLMITFVTLYKSVEIGGALLAFEPVLIAIYGYFLYKDRLIPLQLLGIAIAVLGGILLNFS